MTPFPIRIAARSPLSLEHGVEVGQIYTAFWVDPPQARFARIKIFAKGSQQAVYLSPGEWEALPLASISSPGEKEKVESPPPPDEEDSSGDSTIDLSLETPSNGDSAGSQGR